MELLIACIFQFTTSPNLMSSLPTKVSLSPVRDELFPIVKLTVTDEVRPLGLAKDTLFRLMFVVLLVMLLVFDRLAPFSLYRLLIKAL